MKGKFAGCSMSIYGNILPGATKLASLKIDLSKEARQRLKWFTYYENHNRNAELTCRHFGISKRTFYKWKRRFNPFYLETLESYSRKPKRLRKSQIPWQTIDLILKLRDHYPVWSKYKLEAIINNQERLLKAIKTLPLKIQEELKNNLSCLSFLPKLSVSSIGRLLKAKGRIKEKESQRRKRAAKRKRLRLPKDFKVSFFGDLVAFDTKHFYLPWGEKRYQFQAIDIFGKKKFSYNFKTCSSKNGRKFFLMAEKHLPFPIKNALTDGGPEFQDKFDRLLKEKSIPHYYTYPNTPKQNSVCERSIQTDIYEFYNHGNLIPDLDKQNQELLLWNRIYEDIRPHQALGFLTPNEYYEKCKQRKISLKAIYIRCLKNPETVYHVLDQDIDLTKNFFICYT